MCYELSHGEAKAFEDVYYAHLLHEANPCGHYYFDDIKAGTNREAGYAAMERMAQEQADYDLMEQGYDLAIPADYFESPAWYEQPEPEPYWLTTVKEISAALGS